MFLIIKFKSSEFLVQGHIQASIYCIKSSCGMYRDRRVQVKPVLGLARFILNLNSMTHLCYRDENIIHIFFSNFLSVNQQMIIIIKICWKGNTKLLSSLNNVCTTCTFHTLLSSNRQDRLNASFSMIYHRFKEESNQGVMSNER